MSAPLISIIVPIYNVEQYLGQCLESLKLQTYNNVEIICVIDGSPDNSQKIAEAYAKSDRRFRVILKENGGLSSARNLGLEVARGEYILFVDGDDWIEGKTCEIAISKMIEENCDLVIWTYLREYGESSKKKNIYKNNCSFDGEQCKLLHRRIIGPYEKDWNHPENVDALAPVCIKLLKRSIIEENKIRFVSTDAIGPWEDGCFTLNYVEHIRKAVYVDEALYHYRKGSGVTSKYNENLFYLWKQRQEYLKIYIEEKKLDDTYVQCLRNRNAWNLISLSLNYMCLPKENRYRAIRSLFEDETLHKDIKNLSVRHLPVHWKVLYVAAKLKLVPIVYLLFVYMKRKINY